MKIYVQFKNKKDPMTSDIESYSLNNHVLALRMEECDVVIPRENVDYFTLINNEETLISNEDKEEEVNTDA